MNIRNQPLLSIAATCLAVLISCQSVGWLLAWQGFQYVAGIDGQRALGQIENGLTEATFHRDFFQSIKLEAEEIRLNGQLFDYRILAKKGDSLQVVLYHDRKEEALFGFLGMVLQAEKSGNDLRSMPVAIWLAKWLGTAFLLPERPALLPSSTRPLNELIVFNCLIQAQSAPGIFSPPPEGCSA